MAAPRRKRKTSPKLLGPPKAGAGSVTNKVSGPSMTDKKTVAPRFGAKAPWENSDLSGGVAFITLGGEDKGKGKKKAGKKNPRMRKGSDKAIGPPKKSGGGGTVKAGPRNVKTSTILRKLKKR